jgi:hypothetical protein
MDICPTHREHIILVEQFDTEKNGISEMLIVSIQLLELHFRTVFNYFLLAVFDG